MKRIDRRGQRYGRLVVEAWDDERGKWKCLCDCGNTTYVDTHNLRPHKTTSCGCRLKEIQKYGRTTHGEAGTRLYNIWEKMKYRCENPNVPDYPNYGGRGIKVCDEWHNYVPFREWAIANGYADGLTIDRIDVNGDYTPQNCRWATRQAQNRNRQHHITLTANGETHILAEWAEITNIGYGTLRHRYIMGWSDDRIVNEPLRGTA